VKAENRSPKEQKETAVQTEITDKLKKKNFPILSILAQWPLKLQRELV
jgi:hypothetical protein